MSESSTMRRGAVLEPVATSRSGERLCVLLDDATSPQVRLRVAQRDAGGNLYMTQQEFLLPLSALEALRPVEGLYVEV